VNDQTTGLLTANKYSGEHKLRQVLSTTVEADGYRIDQYGLVDKADKRTLTVQLDELNGSNRPKWLRALETDLGSHGYALDGIKIIVKANKDMTDQQSLNFNRDPNSHPDEV